MWYKAVAGILKSFFLIYRMEVIGKENIPKGAAVICGNHTAQHDPLYLIAILGSKDRLYPLSKIENKTKPVIGFLLTKLDVIFVDRGKSDVGAIMKSMRVLKNGGKLCVFPEGTRVKEGQTAEAKRGAIMFSTRGKAPIVPVFITPGQKRPFSRVKIIFGEPYIPEILDKPGSEFMNIQAAELMNRITRLGELNA